MIKLSGLLLLAGSLTSSALYAQNQVPTITSVRVIQGTGSYNIYYDLADAENESCEVFIRASSDGGKTFNIKPLTTLGDVGVGVAPGSDKTITWFSIPGTEPISGEQLLFKVIADDGYRPQIQEIADAIDFNSIYSNFLGVYGNNSPANPEHYEQSRTFIHNYYQSLGLQTELDTFFSNVPDTLLPVRQGINILATIPGMDQGDSTVIMSGHYDTVEDTPGADDNNMSVAICMEAARVLKDYTFRNNLRFANWDLEEIGLLGAYYYALSTKSLDTKAVINFDGISIYKEEPNSQQVPTGFDLLFPAGYAKAEADSFRGNFITMIADAKSGSLNTRAAELAPEVAPSLKFIDLTCPDPSCVVARDLRRSDHAPFWDRAVPAIFFTATTEFRSDCYHMSCDTVANLAFSTKVIQLAASLMADKAGMMHAGYGTNKPTTSGVKENIKPGIVISKPFPNPVDHSCFFEFTLAADADVVINVTDISGRQIDKVSAKLSRGEQTLAWTPSRSIADGNYIASVIVNGTNAQSFQLAVKIDPDRLNHGH